MANCGISVFPEPTKYVDGGPFTSFSELVFVNQAYWYAVLQIEVLTGYEAFASSADVLVNTTKIGVIEPRPVSRYQDLQAYSIIFGTGAFHPPYPYTGSNTLTIRPVTQSDWLIVGNWWVQYWSL